MDWEVLIKGTIAERGWFLRVQLRQGGAIIGRWAPRPNRVYGRYKDAVAAQGVLLTALVNADAAAQTALLQEPP